jgi:hypothetical protein
MTALDVRRRLAVAHAALPLVQAARFVELAGLPSVATVAVLAEAAGSLAAMARRQALLSHMDPVQIARWVTDPADAMAVLGRGRWLPTMQRRVLAVPVRPDSRRCGVARVRGRRVFAGQLSLFSTNGFEIESR